ncbi:MAG: hypothetical protein LBG59_03860 [Candidatus Peribacteria bacterium]|nr:hypothetical protein [Candidatus Peribacteria bacterium]
MLQEQITLAPENVEGDLAFPCFKIAKEFAKNPTELAKDITKKLNKAVASETSQPFSSFLALGPYVNAFIKEGMFAQQVITEI